MLAIWFAEVIYAEAVVLCKNSPCKEYIMAWLATVFEDIPRRYRQLLQIMSSKGSGGDSYSSVLGTQIPVQLYQSDMEISHDPKDELHLDMNEQRLQYSWCQHFMPFTIKFYSLEHNAAHGRCIFYKSARPMYTICRNWQPERSSNL